MKRFYKLITSSVILLILLSVQFSAFGQTDNNVEKKKVDVERYWYIGVNGGVNFLHGDITEYNAAPDKDSWSFGGGGLVGWQFAKWFGVRGEAYYLPYKGKVTSATYGKKGRPYWGTNVEGNTIDMALDFIIDIDDIFKYNPDRKWGFYVWTGIGANMYKAKQFDYNTGELLWARGYEDTKTDKGRTTPTGDGPGGRFMTSMIPVGAGFKYSISRALDIKLESSFRFADSDGMDTDRVDTDELTNDFLNYNSVGISYNFRNDGNLSSMQKNYPTVIFTSDSEVLQANGNAIDVNVSGRFPEKYFNAKAAAYMRAAVVTSTGDTIYGKPMFFKGEKAEGDGIMVNYKEGTSFEYTDQFEYDPTMDVSELFMVTTAYLPKKEAVDASKPLDEIDAAYKHAFLGSTKAADGVITTCFYVYNDQQPNVVPSTYEKETIITEKYRIFFPVNLANLNFRFGMNIEQDSKDEMTAVTDFVELGWSIKNIAIEGWASPEGEETFNEGLSENRTNTALKYMQRQMRKWLRKKDVTLSYTATDEVQFDAKGNGPDWNGFAKGVQESTIKDKNIIMNIVNSADPSKREEEIRNMILVYPELEKEILPTLRRAEVVVNCYEPKKSDAEIAQLALSNPSMLTEEEILYAATDLATDNVTKLNVLRNAISTYPTMWQAYNDAACVEIENDNISKAKVYLTDANNIAPNQVAIIHNLGIVAANEDDYTLAEEYFKQAASLGMNENYALGVLTIRKGEYDKAIQMMSNPKCNYNVALANMLKENFDVAKAALSCAADDAQTNYLRAVLASRMDDSASLYKFLMKAVEQDSDYATKAAADPEFINYHSEPNFISIVK